MTALTKAAHALLDAAEELDRRNTAEAESRRTGDDSFWVSLTQHDAVIADRDRLTAENERLRGELERCGIGTREMHLVADPEITKEDAAAMQAVIAALTEKEKP